MWYGKVSNDLIHLPDCLTYYEKELEEAKTEVKIVGNIEKNLTTLPGISELRFSQLQEIEAILNYLNLELRKLRRRYFQKYLEHYQRALSTRDADKYVDGEPEVVDFEILINEVALIRNKYLGIMKGLENKNYMLGYIVKLRTAGMENVQV